MCVCACECVWVCVYFADTLSYIFIGFAHQAAAHCSNCGTASCCYRYLNGRKVSCSRKFNFDSRNCLVLFTHCINFRQAGANAQKLANTISTQTRNRRRSHTHTQSHTHALTHIHIHRDTVTINSDSSKEIAELAAA